MNSHFAEIQNFNETVGTVCHDRTNAEEDLALHRRTPCNQPLSQAASWGLFPPPWGPTEGRSQTSWLGLVWYLSLCPVVLVPSPRRTQVVESASSWRCPACQILQFKKPGFGFFSCLAACQSTQHSRVWKALIAVLPSGQPERCMSAGEGPGLWSKLESDSHHLCKTQHEATWFPAAAVQCLCRSSPKSCFLNNHPALFCSSAHHHVEHTLICLPGLPADCQCGDNEGILSNSRWWFTYH